MQQPDSVQTQHRKPIVLGILHLVFAALYLFLASNAFSNMEKFISRVPSSYRSAMRTTNFLDIAADGIGFIGLLIAGILLLQRRALGRTITQTTSKVLIAAIVIIVAYTTIAFGSEAGLIIITLYIGVLLRFAYPLIAARLLAPPPEELGLT